MNRLSLRAVVGLAVVATLAGCVVAPRGAYAPMPPRVQAPVAQAPMYFYPERGQDEARQDRDRYECYRWAVAQSGVDPGMTPVSLPPPTWQRAPSRDGADVAAGAVTGAVLGSMTSSRRHSGEGAVIGALFGAALGAIAQESRAQSIEQANAARAQHQEALRQAAQAPLGDFRRAMGACMLGRGYRVG
ncbi:MAG: glycine zipper domain-containing protein [Rubrivivax sp.]|nr:glycine zipper domain-containing protein [Rubrivivax sp.]